jgi:hypothetical protein
MDSNQAYITLIRDTYKDRSDDEIHAILQILYLLHKEFPNISLIELINRYIRYFNNNNNNNNVSNIADDDSLPELYKKSINISLDNFNLYIKNLGLYKFVAKTAAEDYEYYSDIFYQTLSYITIQAYIKNIFQKYIKFEELIPLLQNNKKIYINIDRLIIEIEKSYNSPYALYFCQKLLEMNNTYDKNNILHVYSYFDKYQIDYIHKLNHEVLYPLLYLYIANYKYDPNHISDIIIDDIDHILGKLYEQYIYEYNYGYENNYYLLISLILLVHISNTQDLNIYSSIDSKIQYIIENYFDKIKSKIKSSDIKLLDKNIIDGLPSNRSMQGNNKQEPQGDNEQEPQEVPEQQPQEVPEQQPQEVPEQQPQEVPEQQPREVPEQQPQEVPEQQPQEVPEQQPQEDRKQPIQNALWYRNKYILLVIVLFISIPTIIIGLYYSF